MNWIGTLIVLAIPGVNIIMLFVWAITCKRASKRNFCIAVLVLSLILIALSLAVVAFYGNVIASRGSVVPLFLDQIATGGPLTVTLCEMTRFLLTLDQAVDTVFAALQSAERGDTYVPKLPAACVLHVAEVLRNGRDIPIVFTGIRPGEKIHEIMVSEEECYRTVERGDYYVIRAMLPELGAGPAHAALVAEYSSANVTLDHDGLRTLLGGYLSPAAAEAGAVMTRLTSS
jgi:UDP-glucose 4-epimerase